MDSLPALHCRSLGQLQRSAFAPYIDDFTRHLTECRYAESTIGAYLDGVAHFDRWLTRCRLNIHRLNEAVVQRFLNRHLSRCNCPRPVRRDRHDVSAAVGHLLVVLRANGVIAEPLLETTALDTELQRFDDHMNYVRGLAPKTRRMCVQTVRRLLVEKFAGRPVVMSSIDPEDVRGFIARQSRLYSKPANIGVLISALRGYFRFRIGCGDPVHGLLGVAIYPANWQQASLPKALSRTEIERLLNSLGQPGPSARRRDAIVRCALDLGLRSGEIAKLGSRCSTRRYDSKHSEQAEHIAALHPPFDSHAPAAIRRIFHRDRAVVGPRKRNDHASVRRSRFGDERESAGPPAGARHDDAAL